MRKYIFLFPVLIIINIFFMGVPVKADNREDLIKYLQDNYNVTYSITSYAWEKFESYCQNNPNQKILIRNSDSSSLISSGNVYYSGSNNDTINYRNPCGIISRNATSGDVTIHDSDYGISTSASNIYVIFNSYQDMLDNIVQIDFNNIYYSPNIPLPDMDVYYLLSSNIGDRVAMWNSNMTIADNTDFYIQYGIKISIPGIVGIGLDSTTGNYTYSYDQYSEGSYIDILPLSSLTPCVNISFGSDDYQASWQSAYDLLYDTVPEFYAKIPFWQQNPNASKYVSAQTYYKDNMMNQIPMFGNRLEIFARLFTVNEDNQVIVGDWLHWSSRTGSRTQEKPSNYIDNVVLPGYVNSSNNVNLESQDNTYQQSGESIGAPSTVINNNYAPNYPDYPTIASYNKDNLLLDTMGYMSNMNNFLSGPNGFGSFLTEVFTFIPAYVWGMVAMGFGVAIIVMFIKML